MSRRTLKEALQPDDPAEVGPPPPVRRIEESLDSIATSLERLAQRDDNGLADAMYGLGQAADRIAQLAERVTT